MEAKPLKIEVAGIGEVSGLWQAPETPSACLALAHGAGAGMTHCAMTAIADGLEGLGVATLRYQFPYMEKGSKRPDGPAVAHPVVRAAVAEARRRADGLPLFAGGRSFGGRMTSQAQALEPLPDVRGLVFFAFPLHLAGKPSVARAEHLSDVGVPMLFLQGTHDALAELDLLQQTVVGIGKRATLYLIADADHAFHVPARTGRRDPNVLASALATAVLWIAETGSQGRDRELCRGARRGRAAAGGCALVDGGEQDQWAGDDHGSVAAGARLS
jgi:predicted alpha/beta-hydrolase family hydrolase